MENQTLLSIILICLLLTGGYIFVLRTLKQHSEVRKAFPAVAMILLFLFVLFGIVLIFITMVLNAELVLMTLLLMIALVTVCASLTFLVRNFRSLNWGSLVLLICYLLAVGYITVFSRTTAGDHRISLFRTDLFIKALQMHSIEPLRHIFLNCAMFIPVGFLMPLVQPGKLKHMANVILLSMTLSILIETIQLVTQIGQADLTDVAANTLGGIAGYLICMIFLHTLFVKNDVEDDY